MEGTSFLCTLTIALRTVFNRFIGIILLWAMNGFINVGKEGADIVFNTYFCLGLSAMFLPI